MLNKSKTFQFIFLILFMAIASSAIHICLAMQGPTSSTEFTPPSSEAQGNTTIRLLNSTIPVQNLRFLHHTTNHNTSHTTNHVYVDPFSNPNSSISERLMNDFSSGIHHGIQSVVASYTGSILTGIASSFIIKPAISIVASTLRYMPTAVQALETSDFIPLRSLGSSIASFVPEWSTMYAIQQNRFIAKLLVQEEYKKLKSEQEKLNTVKTEYLQKPHLELHKEMSAQLNTKINEVVLQSAQLTLIEPPTNLIEADSLLSKADELAKKLMRHRKKSKKNKTIKVQNNAHANESSTVPQTQAEALPESTGAKNLNETFNELGIQ